MTECFTEESSAGGSETNQASTRPSILGGGQSASSRAPQVEVSPSGVSPSGPQRQLISQAPYVPAAQETPILPLQHNPVNDRVLQAPKSKSSSRSPPAAPLQTSSKARLTSQKVSKKSSLFCLLN
jgi:hypothetical protein